MRPAVLVYREDHRTVATADAVRDLIRRFRVLERGSVDDALGALIAAGELESAVSDALFQQRDGVDERAATLRRVSIAAGHKYLDVLAGAATKSTVVPELDRLLSLRLPAEIEVRPSEGYAYYALFPETYAASARRLWNDLQPRRVCVIGIRSIGTSLAAVVAAALQPEMAVSSYTVRPRGHPFDRHIALDSPLHDAWDEERRSGASFVVVDEGPGLSGSSFASVVRALHELGVPSDRIVLLPSWDPPPEQLRSEAARNAWRLHRRYVTSASECGISPETIFGIRQPAVDWSAGRWRSHVLFQDGWPAVHPQHERWKVRVPEEKRLLKFAGLGHYGESVLERARRIATATATTQTASEARHGFLDVAWVNGETAHAPFSEAEAEAVGRYIGLRAAEFGMTPAGAADLTAMIQTNVRELLGNDKALSSSAIDRMRSVFAAAPMTDIDGRMLAHEWVRTASGLTKVDAFDHAHDHFFPGPQNAAWDLAGASLELRLSDGAMRRMLDAYRRASGDIGAEERMTIYRLAYAAFRAGYAAMAAETLAGTTEAERFLLVVSSFRNHLQRLIPSVL